MRVFIAGLGSIGTRHARNLRALGVSDILACDTDEAQRTRIGSQLGVAVTPHFDEIEAFRPDLTVICTPSAMHVGQAKKAASAGSHLFIEKPVGLDIDAVADLAAEVERRGLFAHIGSNWKFHPAFRRMKQLIDSAAIGRVVSAQVKFGWWLPDWRPGQDYRKVYAARRALGGGVINDNHELDLLAWLFGPIRDWRGFKASCPELETDVDDVASLVLQFESGSIATLSLDYIERVYTRWYHITGTLGSLSWDYNDGVILIRRRSPEANLRIDVQQLDLNDMFVEQMRHVLSEVKEGGKPVTPIAAALDIMRIQQSREQVTEFCSSGGGE